MAAICLLSLLQAFTPACSSPAAEFAIATVGHWLGFELLLNVSAQGWVRVQVAPDPCACVALVLHGEHLCKSSYFHFYSYRTSSVESLHMDRSSKSIGGPGLVC